MSDSSYRTILRSSSIVGGAQVINIAVGLVKMKIVAVLLGPAGVGLAGLYMSLVQTASSVAAMGLGSVGTRQIAAANAEGGDEAVGRTRRALFWGTMGLGAIGGLAFWLASSWIARVVLADEARAHDVALLAVGVALTVAASSQGALLTGLRRIGDLARVNVWSGAFGAILGVLSLWLWGDKGLIAMVLAAPVASFLVGHYYVARLGPPSGAKVGLGAMSQEWRVMLTLGFAFMVSGVVAHLGHLAVRALVQRELGAEALGHFQAAWTIGMTYLGFVLGAMGADYYPRLTAAITDKDAACRLVNEQTEVALLLCAPPLLAVLGLVPWVIHLLYSAEFGPAVEILRWQLLGDILKVMSWPLGFVILARGAGNTFVISESIGVGVFVVGVALLLPLIGIVATGIAFLAMYVIYLPLVLWLGGRPIDFQWTLAVKLQALGVIAAAVMVDGAARWSEPLGAILGVGLAAVMAGWALLRLSAITGATGRFAMLVAWEDRVKRWMIKPR